MCAVFAASSSFCVSSGFGVSSNTSRPRAISEPTITPLYQYVDQLERSKGLSEARISALRQGLTSAEGASGAARTSALSGLASQLESDAANSSDAAKVRTLAVTLRSLR